ncbi:MAG: hypothetical protein WDN02_15545 [Methylovirgula sp.]|uniref:hypothetical protein n=1 Tax=Methylovirgula sp. TaxID=1978224 RepID=UPI003076726F
MAALAAPGCSPTRFKILVCVLVASAGLIAGRLSFVEPSQHAITAQRRTLATPEKNIIVAAIAQTLKDATVATIAWPPLILTSREGISDYCAIVKEADRDVGFYAQLIFPHVDPSEKLSQVNFAIIAVADDLEARYLVSVACLRYGYGAIMPTAP